MLLRQSLLLFHDSLLTFNLAFLHFLSFAIVGADSKSEGPGKAADNIPKVCMRLFYKACRNKYDMHVFSHWRQLFFV